MKTSTKAKPESKARTRTKKPEVPLYPYQEQWVRDSSRFKIAVKATQIGYSFAAALEAVLDCLEHRTLWIVLSRGERQSLEFMQKAREHAQAMRIASSPLETSFFEKTDILQHEIQFPNGSRILSLPANPDTARGYTGNMILDEFAFHQQDREIWAAAFGRISRGELKLRVISTPNGQRGKYFEIAKEAGLTENALPSRDREGAVVFPAGTPLANARGSETIWSGHWCDVHAAVRQGCPINVAALRQAIGDEETWQEEYECVFRSDSENYIPLGLLAACEHPQASTALPADWPAGGGHDRQEYLSHGRECYLGYDVARVHDLAVLAVIEKVGDVFWTRALVEMPHATFSVQEQTLRDFLPLCRRGAVDSTGMGMQMAERLAAQFPGKVEPVLFNAARKQEMAIRMKRHFEERTLRIPENRSLRRDLNAVKRTITSAGNIRFDAERTEAGHADRFWALALALHAAGSGQTGAVASGAVESERGWYAPQAPPSIYEPDTESSGTEEPLPPGRGSDGVAARIGREDLGGMAWA
ncbi:MAG: hypothetical protein HYS38_06365 [Acidobacteria bacterium]|nr:hypothetical protein [Acidobacteriota bacterium]